MFAGFLRKIFEVAEELATLEFLFMMATIKFLGILEMLPLRAVNTRAVKF